MRLFQFFIDAAFIWILVQAIGDKGICPRTIVSAIVVLIVIWVNHEILGRRYLSNGKQTKDS